MNTGYEKGAVVIANLTRIAAWQRLPKAPGRLSTHPSIQIFASGCVDDGAYVPDQSIYIGGVHELRALRSAIDEALKYEEAAPPAA